MKAIRGKEKKLLKAQIEGKFGEATPVSLRPEPGLWKGYGPPTPTPTPALRGTLFAPRLLVFTLRGQRLSLPTTLRLTNALRGTLLKGVDSQGDVIPE